MQDDIPIISHILMADIHSMEIVLLTSFILGTGFMDTLLQMRRCFSIRKELVTLVKCCVKNLVREMVLSMMFAGLNVIAWDSLKFQISCYPH